MDLPPIQPLTDPWPHPIEPGNEQIQKHLSKVSEQSNDRFYFEELAARLEFQHGKSRESAEYLAYDALKLWQMKRNNPKAQQMSK